MSRLPAAALLAALAMLLAAPAGALAQSSFFFGADPGTEVVGGVQASFEAKGAVTVDFHGDPASGCESVGLCGVSGSVTWKPAREGEIFAVAYRKDGEQVEAGFLATGDDDPDTTAATYGQTRRTGGLCTDASRQSFALVDLGTSPGSSVAVSLTGATDQPLLRTDFFRTRCAGPSIDEIAPLLPRHSVSQRSLLRRRQTLDFKADAPFASHGLAGTVHSTVVLRTRRGERIDADGDDADAGEVFDVELRTGRTVEADYRVESVSGEVVTEIAGIADPDLCAPLDSCGMTGTVTLKPRAGSGDGFAIASGPASLSTRELERALGLVPGPRVSGIETFGYALWSDGGYVTSELARDGAPDCHDSAPLPATGGVQLTFTRRRVRAYYSGGAESSGQDPLRTRCPGPSATDATLNRALATGSLPLAAMRGRRVTLHLTRGASFRGDGWSGTTRPDVTVVLRRTRIRARAGR